MTTNLPASISALIPVILHAKVAAAYAETVESLIASHVDQAKEDILRGIVGYVASYGLVESPAPVATTQDALGAVLKKHIVSGERGVLHDQFLATFRAKFPNGEREMREMINCYPPGATMGREHINAIKLHFCMGERSTLLSPVLRHLGCRYDSRGMWITPVLRIEDSTPS
jgi:hypothetical protein